MIPSSWRKAVQRRLHALSTTAAQLKEERSALQQTRILLRNLSAAQKLAQGVAQQVQNQAHAQISQLVSRCLEAVFDEPYVFKIVFERKRGRTEAQLLFEREGLKVDPLTASGGGVVDVAAFALRVSCLLLSQPPLRRTLVLDEPFRFVSEEFRPRVRALLLSLSKETGVQFLLVTHDRALRAGKIVALTP